ncbi:MAG: patatin-like phospholipase family protein [Candidatus Nitrosopolaris sp.]
MVATAITFESDKPRPQRALILQGGGALGAYEAGAFRALYEFLSKEDKEKQLFDIVAGTSIGAINAAILVSHVIENGTWEGSVDSLLEFWDDISRGVWDVSDLNIWWNNWWNGLRSFNEGIASAEAARRYYTAKLAGYIGAPQVFSLIPAVNDTKYFDNFGIPNNMWFRYDPNRLKESIQKYCNFPIKSNAKREEPRLLTISTDILVGVPVVFDSYLLRSNVKVDGDIIYAVDYGDGIQPDQVIASASVPINYAYKVIQDTKGDEHYLWDGGLLSNTPLTELLQAHHYYYYENKVEEMAGPGSENWKNLTDDDWKKISIPDIKEVYLVNVNPTLQKDRPSDHDNALSRCLDISLSDKTRIVQSTLQTIGDMIDIVGSYRDLAMRLVNEFGIDTQQSPKITKVLKNFISDEAYKRVSDPVDKAKLNEIHEAVLGIILYGLKRDKKIDAKRIEEWEKVLEKEIGTHHKHVRNVSIPEKRLLARKNRSTLSAFIPKQYGMIPKFDLDNASFRVNNIQRIERKHDPNDIAGKMFDFSKNTIIQLINDGYNDASNQLRVVG